MNNSSNKIIICPKCGEEKPISEFGYRHDKEGNNKPQSWCKECRSKFARYKSKFKDKESLIKGIEESIEELKNITLSDVKNEKLIEEHSRYLEKFLKKVQSQDLPDFTNSSWSYSFYIEDKGCGVCMETGITMDDGRIANISSYRIVHIEPRNLTVTEYAALHGISEDAVNEAISKCRIRKAVMYLNTWYIPAFETIDSGEYINSYYRWDESIEAFPEEYAFISEFNRVRILNAGNGKYRVRFSNKKSDGELIKEYDENERIKLELELIKNPLIVRGSVPSISPDDENLRNAVISA